MHKQGIGEGSLIFFVSRYDDLALSFDFRPKAAGCFEVLDFGGDCMTFLTASYSFNANQILTLGIAAYAAVISTFVLGWDAYKWLASGAKIDLSVSPGMKIFGGHIPDPNTYISVVAFNMGDRPTTITNLGGMYFDSWWTAYITKRKPKEAFLIPEPSQVQRLPYRFDVGAQWIGLAEQSNDIQQKAKDGYLFLILYTAGGGHGYRARIRIRERTPDANVGEQAAV